jgi:hypothetical protein
VTCRFCHGYESTARPLFRYSIRHYTHQTCGFAKWGAAFLDKLSPHDLGHLAFMDLQDRGLLDEVRRRIEENKRAREARS